MNNLFSVFDPKALASLPLNWLSSLVILMMIPSSFWLLKSRTSVSMSNFLKAVNGEFIAIFGSLMAPGSTFLMVSMLLYVVLNNFLGLAPYIFTSPSHLTFTVSMALPLWIGHMIYAWVLTPNSMLAHLVPLGTPYPLMPLMVLIELVSSMIRPLTLSVRLAANMVAGHLLLTLLGNQVLDPSLMIFCLGLTCLILLGTLESAVALIQGYVFSVLSTLYVNEVNNLKFN